MSKKVLRQSLRKQERAGLSSDLVTLLVASVSIALPLMFYLHQHVEMLQYGYQIEDLKTQRQVLAERQRELRGEVAQTTDFGRVETEAHELGLSAPRTIDLHAMTTGPRTVAVAWREGSADLD